MITTEIKGKVFGIRLSQRGKNDKHAIMTVLMEDDETWFEKNVVLSSYWLDDMIKTLQRTKELLQSNEGYSKCSDGYGYDFKKEQLK